MLDGWHIVKFAWTQQTVSRADMSTLSVAFTMRPKFEAVILLERSCIHSAFILCCRVLHSIMAMRLADIAVTSRLQCSNEGVGLSLGKVVMIDIDGIRVGGSIHVADRDAWCERAVQN